MTTGPPEAATGAVKRPAVPPATTAPLPDAGASSTRQKSRQASAPRLPGLPLTLPTGVPRAVMGTPFNSSPRYEYPFPTPPTPSPDMEHVFPFPPPLAGTLPTFATLSTLSHSFGATISPIGSMFKAPSGGTVSRPPAGSSSVSSSSTSSSASFSTTSSTTSSTSTLASSIRADPKRTAAATARDVPVPPSIVRRQQERRGTMGNSSNGPAPS
ncbi:hypothetical protein BC834DRAFT_882923 [Gloeopeniophorella convolvens]|nr:hypothetical protein BC834DRAFT_882923 [Gloeopeniophorella convolvens]